MVILADQRRALDELGAWLRERFGARLARFALFGSLARNEGSEDSDVDVLVAVDGLTSAEGREVAHACGDLLTRYDVLVSPFTVSRERYDDLCARERRIAVEIERDAVPL